MSLNHFFHRRMTIIPFISIILLILLTGWTTTTTAALSPVYKLNEHSLRHTLKTKEYIIMVHFYYEGFPTKVDSKTWSDAASTLEGFIPLAEFDCSSSRDFCNSQDVAYQSSQIRFYKIDDSTYGGPKGAEYQHATTAKAIIAFCLLHLRNPTILLTDDNLGSFLASSFSTYPLIVIYFSDKRSTPSIYKALAMHFHQDFRFFEVRKSPSTASVLQQFTIDSTPAMIAQLGYNGAAVRYAGEWNDIAAMKRWLLQQALPIEQKRDPDARRYEIKTPSVFPTTPFPNNHINTAAKPSSDISASTTETDSSASPKSSQSDAKHYRPNDGPHPSEIYGNMPQLVDESCYQHYCVDSKKDCVITIISPKQMGEMSRVNSLLKTMERVEEMKKRDFQFVWLNSDIHYNFAALAFGIPLSFLPKIVYLDSAHHRYIRLAPSVGYESTATLVALILNWLNNISSHRLAFTDIPKVTMHGRSVYPQLHSHTATCASMKSEPKPNVMQKILESSTAVYRPSEDENKKEILEEGSLIQLSERRMKEFVLHSSQSWVILFCNSLAPECGDHLVDFIRAARKLGNEIRFGLVDTHTDTNLADEFHLDHEQASAVKYFRYNIPVKLPSMAESHIDPENTIYDSMLELSGQLLDDHLIKAVSANSFGDWVTHVTGDGQYAETDFVLRILIFVFSHETPTMFRALSQKWRGQVEIGVVVYTESVLLTRFRVTAIPSTYIFETPIRPTPQQLQQPETMVQYDQPLKYEGTLSFNHLDRYIQQRIQAGRNHPSVSSSKPSTHQTTSRASDQTHDEL